MSTETNEVAVAQRESVALCVADITEDVSLVAENVEQMQLAQSQMTVWFHEKCEILKRELKEQEEQLAIAEREGWKVSSFRAAATKLAKRIEFYHKCELVSAAGYCIVPNLPCDLFAVRTNRLNPSNAKSGSRQDIAAAVRSESPPAGEGIYVDDASYTRHATWDEKQGDRTVTHHHYTASDFDEVIDFPISICKPQIMSATARAMALNVFDEFAVVDDAVHGVGVNAGRSGRNTKGDPLVIGIIRDPRRSTYSDKRISFLIGWYVDTSVL